MRMLTLVLAVLALSAFIGCQSKPMVGSDAQSGQEGITVHGNWTVEVRNPDGSLATRKQFTNYILGQNVVAAFLSFDLEVDRKMHFSVKDSPADLDVSDDANCKGLPKYNHAPATVIHAPNDDGFYYNSVWNASCTLEINGDEPKFLTRVVTIFNVIPKIWGNQPPGDKSGYNLFSDKELAEPIEVWDGQVIAATVIFSVD